MIVEENVQLLFAPVNIGCPNASFIAEQYNVTYINAVDSFLPYVNLITKWNIRVNELYKL